MGIESGFEFWAAKLVPGKVVKCQVSDALLHVTSIALDETITNGKQRTVVSVLQGGEKSHVIASLRENACEHVSVDLLFRENEEIKFRCTGSTPVHLVGYVQPLAEDSEDVSDDEDFVPEAEENVMETEKLQELPEESEDEASLSGSSDEEVEKPVAKIVGQKRDVADLSSSDESSDEEEEEECSPPAKKAKQQVAPKAQKKQSAEQTPKKQQKPVQQKTSQKPVEEKTPQKPVEEKTPQKPVEEKTPQKPVKEKTPQKPVQETPQKQSKEGVSKKKAEFRKLQGGVMVLDTEVGVGKVAKSGKVGVFYTGRLKDGKVFDSNVKNNKPFRFSLGSGEVIKGWDIGVKGMKVGGKRKIIIPPKMGYGKAGAGNDIPPNSVLIFDVELAQA